MTSVVLILFILLQISPLLPQDEYLVKNFTVDDGLPVNSINGIVQDDDGYLWFSSLDGLVRYDGYNFKVYNSGNTEEIHSNRISGILRTASDEIWMIYPDGAVTRKTGNTFKTYTEVNNDFRGNTNRLLATENGDLWISTSEGIFRFMSDTESFHAPKDPLLNSNTWALESRVGGGMFALNKEGLLFWNGNKTTTLVENSDFPIPPENVLHIKQFTVNDVWIIGGGGLFKYSLYSNEIDFVFKTENPSSTVWNFHHDSDGSYIINTSEGFYSWEPVTQNVVKLQPKISTTTDRINLVFRGANNEEILLGDDEVLIDGQNVFQTDEIQSGFIDREGSLWISTLREGVFQIRKSDFVNISSDDIDGFENIYPIIQSGDGSVWAGSFVNGIYRISAQETENWNTSNSNLTGNLCRFLFEDRDGNIYASLWGDGLWQYSEGDWERVDFDGLADPGITTEAMARDHRDRLLIGNNGPLLVKHEGKFSLFAQPKGDELKNIRVIRENVNGTLFMGTNGNGFTVVKGDEVRNYTTRNSDLTSDFIRDVYVQSADTLWLATENLGLNRLILDADEKLSSVTPITEKDGLIKNSLHKIIRTPDNHLWISSNSGIMRIPNKELNRYADGLIPNLSIMVIDEKDGMVNREANGGIQTAGMYSAKQKLWFPNQKGISIIDPYAVEYENSLPSPQPFIEEILLPDTSLVLGDQSEFQIPGYHRNLRIKFSAPNFSNPQNIQFRYKLEGVNNSWENAGQSLEAIFTNIPAGTHQFLVQTHKIGNVSEVSEASVLITIPPRFFETNGSYLMLAVIGILAIFGGIKYRTRVLEAREQKLQERVDLQTRELLQAAEQKSRFFSGITHELKTPLSLISGPLEDLLDRPDEIPDHTIHKLQMMNRNNHRLQNLVDQILDVTRLNADALRMTVKPVKIVKFTRQIAGQFQSKLEKYKIELSFNSDSSDELIYLDPAAWERIVINLMSNAIQYSPENTTIHISLQNRENQVHISFKDEGAGIAEDDTEKVFGYLYQGKNSGASGGTGIGLFLVKGLVEHMGGTIQLISKKGEGAEFLITLKKGFEHFNKDDSIIHEPFVDEFKKLQPVDRSKITSFPIVSARTHQILVVEDNDDFREYLESKLSDQYEVSVAPEGEKAMQILEHSQPDLILSDVMMPKMDGLEFINKVRQIKRYEHLPVIFLSAKDRDIDKESGLSTGADIYLSKPIKNSLLLSQIAAVLRREKLLKDAERIKNSNDPLLTDQVRTLIYRQLANPALNVDMLADALFMSRRKLYKEWKKNDQVSLNEYIKAVRLDEAKILLSEKKFSVQETALAVGFTNTPYFSTSFKKRFGMSPSEV